LPLLKGWGLPLIVIFSAYNPSPFLGVKGSLILKHGRPWFDNLPARK